MVICFLQRISRIFNPVKEPLKQRDNETDVTNMLQK